MKKQFKKALQLFTMFAISLLLVAVLSKNTRIVFAEDAYVATVTTAGDESTSYTSLANAISAAEASEGSTVTLLKDITMTEKVEIDSGTFTIDLNGYCWEYCWEYSQSPYIFSMDETANVTVTDTSENKTGILKSSANAIYADGQAVTITGGTIDAAGVDIFWVQGTINLGTYSSSDGISVSRGGSNTLPITAITLPDGYVLADKNLYKVDDFSGANKGISTRYIVKQNNTQTVTFDVNGGTGSIASTVTTVEGKLASLPGAAHDSLFLEGWYDAREGGNKITPDSVFTEATTIYAQYNETCNHYAFNITDGKCACGKEYICAELNDSFEDGWGDNAIELWKNGEKIETMTITEEQGASATYLLEYDSSAKYFFKWIEGLYSEDCNFTIYVAGEKKLDITPSSDSFPKDGEKFLFLGFAITVQPAADNLTVTTNDENATYQWYQVEWDALNIATDTLLEGNTAKTLADSEAGKSYACLVTFSDQTTEASEVVCCLPAITTQPTVSNPTVQTNDTEATYQWYEASDDMADVTAEDNLFDSFLSNYSDGWFTGIDNGLIYCYFALDLEAGDVVTVSTDTPLETAPDLADIYDFEKFCKFESCDNTGQRFTVEVPEKGIWEVDTVESSTMKATRRRITVDTTNPLEDETGATLQNPLPGKGYACVVTFADGTTETSEVITYDEATFSGTNITLKDTIDMNFYVTLPEGITDAAVKFTVNETEKATVDLVAVNNGGYQATYQVAAKEMTDEITAELMVGETVVTSYTTSVRNYAEEILNDTTNTTYTAETQALVKAMLNYGAYAQVYFDYKTSMDLANAGYEYAELAVNTEDLASYVPAVAFSTDGEAPNYTSTNGITYLGSSLLLESQIKVRHYFNVGKNTKHGLTNKTGAGYYYVDTAVAIADMEDGKPVTVDDYSVTYCPLNYITTVLCSKESSKLKADDKLQNLMKALYLYYELADTYPN